MAASWRPAGHRRGARPSRPGGALSAAEARLGRASPKLSKFCKIGENADILLHAEVLPRLSGAEYTISYEMLLLHDILPGDRASRTGCIVQIIGSVEGDISRQFLKNERKRLTDADPSADDAGRSAPIQVPPAGPSIGSMPHVAGGGQAYDLVLIEPTRNDRKLLNEDYPDPETITQLFRVFNIVADDAVVIAIAAIADVSTILRLLPLCGFGRPSHALLERQPASPDVLGDKIVMVAQRGRAPAVTIPGDFWNGNTSPIANTAVADLLVPDATRKLHAFATVRTSGWTSLIGDENWIERPSLQ